MGKIVLGIGASHTPLLAMEARHWMHRAAVDYANKALNLSDGRALTYEELLKEVGPRYAAMVTPEILADKAQLCSAALDRLGQELAAADPDVVIIVGDDQRELFDANNQPTLAIYHGAELETQDKYRPEGAPEHVQQVGKGYLMDTVHRFAAAPELALEVIAGLMERDVDVATVAGVEDARKRGFGHAYGFIVQRLMGARRIPVLPVILNTYYPPNVPSSRRTYAMGRALAAAVAASPSQARVAVVASGGLSHFVVDETLDRGILGAFERNDAEYLSSIPREALISGSSEILNWVMTAAAVADLPLKWSEYHALYRTAAGTGVGAAFAVWKPAG
jgi:aromatic ring-opening dioxygenase catalytic subunit (LigB family)